MFGNPFFSKIYYSVKYFFTGRESPTPNIIVIYGPKIQLSNQRSKVGLDNIVGKTLLSNNKEKIRL